LTRAACTESAAVRSNDWQKTHPSLTVSDPKCSPIAQAGRALDLIEVAPGVYVHKGGIGIPSPSNGGDLANLGVVIGEDSVAVIDTGSTRAVGEGLYLAIRAITEKPISHAILTHMHPDHSLGARVFVEAGASVIGHAKLDRGLRARAANYEASLEQLIGYEGFLGTKAAFPTQAIQGTQEIDLGGRILHLRAWQTAHTDNDITVFDERTRTLFTGDLVFAEHTPALDGSLLGWSKVLEQFDWPIDRVVPGHGGPSIPWPTGGDPQRAYLATLTRDTRAAILKGESIAEAVDHIAQSEREKWKLFNEFNIRNATAAYKELEWE
jgi:quinoprotein relay system zinc metallohydrolase 2